MDHRVEVTRGRVYCADDIERAGNRASDYRRDEVTRRNEEQRSQSEGGFAEGRRFSAWKPGCFSRRIEERRTR